MRYFSRSVIPFVREETKGLKIFRHHGIYGYTLKLLFQFVKWQPTLLEHAESLEQLRALEHGAKIRVIITKSKIGGFGLNFQHCAHVVTFVSHSYEQHYQSVRRCWRFGQKNPVTVDIIATEGEEYVAANMVRKAQAADKMFSKLLEHMNAAKSIAASAIVSAISALRS